MLFLFLSDLIASKSEILLGDMVAESAAIHHVGHWVSESAGEAVVLALSQILLLLVDEAPSL